MIHEMEETEISSCSAAYSEDRDGTTTKICADNCSGCYSTEGYICEIQEYSTDTNSCRDGLTCAYDPLEAARRNGEEYLHPCEDIANGRGTRITRCQDADENAPSDSAERICQDNCNGCYSDEGFICKTAGSSCTNDIACEAHNYRIVVFQLMEENLCYQVVQQQMEIPEMIHMKKDVLMIVLDAIH